VNAWTDDGGTSTKRIANINFNNLDVGINHIFVQQKSDNSNFLVYINNVEVYNGS